ncbi:MAG: hypothetical protein WEC15_01880 [Flavobacteriales bacterium]
MKKLFSLAVVVLFATTTAHAQNGSAEYGANEVSQNIHDRSGSQFAANVPRIRASINPNPLVTRSTLDAGGAVIRGVVISNEDGRELRRHSNLNTVRFVIEGPGLSPGSYKVEVHTDFGMTVLKLAVQ